MKRITEQKGRLLEISLALVLALTMILTGCSSKETPVESATPAAQETEDAATPEPTEKPLEPVVLTWYMPGVPQKDHALMEEALNKILQEKINTTVKINVIDFNNYEQKMNVMISSGEEFDLAFTATWMNNYYDKAGKGAYVELDELLDTHAPMTKAGVPDNIWQAAVVNGKTYGVINYQIMATAYGVNVQKELADKYQFDWKAVTKAEDLEPFLAAIKKGETGKVGLEYNSASDPFTGAAPLYGLDVVGDQKSPGWVYLKDQEYKVVNQYDTPEFKKLIATMRDWFQKGYLRKDAATTKELDADRKTAKYAAVMPSYLSSDSLTDPETKGSLSGVTNGTLWYDKMLTVPLVTTDRAAATITAISKTSKHPDRAMMLLELINSDKQVFNTLIYGVEGIHYTKVNDHRASRIKDSGYSQSGFEWLFGNNLNMWLPDGWKDGGIEEWDNLNKQSQASPLLGFTFNSESVKSQIAQCQTIIDEYLASLTSGSVDPDKKQPEFIAKLKTAGMDGIIAEKQKPIDAWSAANGK